MLNSKIRRENETIDSHLEDLLNCSTSWAITENTYSDGTVEKKAHAVICNNRDCIVCYDDRLVEIKQKLRKLLNPVPNLRLVTLTFGKNVKPTPEIKREYRLKFYNYKRRLSKLGVKFAGVSTWEYKRQKNGLYHVHIHIAFAGVSPHHLTTSKEWAQTLGVGWVDTDTKYRTTHKHVINYFAKRVAGAGLQLDYFDEIGIPPEEYLEHIKHTKLYAVFGQIELYYRLEIQAQLLNNENLEKKLISVQFLFAIVKKQNETIPPPPELIAELARDVENDRIAESENSWSRRMAYVLRCRARGETPEARTINTSGGTRAEDPERTHYFATGAEADAYIKSCVGVASNV